MIQEPDRSTPMVWARFRFSVVGALLSSPPPRGSVSAALDSLAAKIWLGLDLALSVATGTPCLGKYAVPQPEPVLIYLAEDALTKSFK